MAELKLDPLPHEGIHRALYHRACVCRERGLTTEQAWTEICALAKQGTRRAIPERELHAAIRDAYGKAPTDRPKAFAPARFRPVFHEKKARAFAAAGFNLDDLWERSPIRFDEERATAEILTDLYRPAEYLCLLERFDEPGTTIRLRDWLQIGDLHRWEFVVPNPMRKATGTTTEGRTSPRSKDNAVKEDCRRYLVFESDQFGNGIDLQAAIIWRLNLEGGFPLVLAVHSGRKSLHAWFRVEGASINRIRRWIDRAIVLGADPAAFRTAQPVRLPDGTRADGTRQRVFYFNPEAAR